MAKWINDYPNLVIAKTFSKIYGMAGARAGFALAHPETIKKINALQPWPNAGVSAVTLAGAMASLDDQEFVTYCKKENAKAKAIFYSALDKAGMPYIRSHTSFVYFNTAPFGKDVKELLEKNNIIGCRTFEDGTAWRRLSIGTVDEMKKVASIITA
jgi:histidinol-phosphate aminotransferase